MPGFGPRFISTRLGSEALQHSKALAEGLTLGTALIAHLQKCMNAQRLAPLAPIDAIGPQMPRETERKGLCFSGLRSALYGDSGPSKLSA